MTRLKTALVCSTLCLFTVGLSTGGAAILSTVQEYSGACSSLGGFPGLLQKAGFVAAGPCKLDPILKLCAHHECVTAKKKLGECVKVVTRNEIACFCEAKHVSGD